MIKVKDLFPLMMDAFAEGKNFLMPIKGTSMMPLWRTGTKVELEKVDSIHKKDILFFKKADDSFVLHRVWKIKGTSIFMIGDHQLSFEEIDASQCFAKVVAYYNTKNKKKYLKGIKYRLYCFSLRFWLVRRLYIRCLH